MTTENMLQGLARLFDESCMELFSGFNCQIQKTEDNMVASIYDPIAMIDAGSPEIELAIILRLPVNILALSYPSGVDITHVSEETLEDWIAEISSQLIGKIKNKLLNYDLRLSLGLPNSYFGIDVGELLIPGRQCVVSVFNIDNELLEVIMMIDIHDPNIDLSTPLSPDEGLGGGELELF